MPDVEIPLGDFLPSAPTYKNPGCEVAHNCLPTLGGYGSFPGLIETDDTLTGTCRGAREFFDRNGERVIVGATSSHLFTLRSAVVETSGYSDAVDNWDFCRFNDFVIATGQGNAPQYLTDIDTDDAWSALPGSPPVASRCAKVNEFVMLGGIDGAPTRIQWSAFNNPAGSWAADRLTQAGFADLDSAFGQVQRIVGGRFGLVFQERGIQALSYVGPPQVWRTDILSRERGAVAPHAVIPVGFQVYFLAQDGFYRTNGSSFEPIGTARINRWFFEELDEAEISSVQGCADWRNEGVIWRFPTATGGQKAIFYSWALDRWSTMDTDAGWLLSAMAAGTTLEELAVLHPDLEAVPFSLDSTKWRGLASRLSAFGLGATPAFGQHVGEPLDATWRLGEFQPAPHRRVFVDEVTPVMEADNWDMTIQMFGRGNRGGDVSTSAVECGWSGFAPVKLEAAKMQVEMKKPSGEWESAQAVQVRYRVAGQR